MDILIEKDMQFPMAKLSMAQGETARIAYGSMVYRTDGVDLNAGLNASGSGLGKFVKAVARSAVSGESVFITEVVSNVPGRKARSRLPARAPSFSWKSATINIVSMTGLSFAWTARCRTRWSGRSSERRF